MNAKSFADRLRSPGPSLIGTLLSMDGRDTVDILCRCGFDWLFLDLEHSALSIGDAKTILQVVAGRVPVLVRVASNTPTQIQAALDIGSDGVIVPLVNSKDEAEAAVRSAKYPSLGARSVGIARAHGYGAEFQEAISNANLRTAVVVQIEHRLGVENLSEILQIRGVDAIFVGPYDLSGSLNRLGNIGHEDVQAAILEIRSQCHAAGKPYGSFAMTVPVCEEEIRRGARFMVLGTDAMHLYHGAVADLTELQSNGCLLAPE